MKAQELRIGVYISNPSQNNKVFKVTAKNIGAVISNHIQSPYNGVELTEEWLLKMGFKYNDVDVCYCLVYDYYRLEFNFEEQQEFWLNDLTINIKHVHQLQNLYFALTGEELTIKE